VVDPLAFALGQSLDASDLMAPLDAEGRGWSIRWLSRRGRPIPDPFDLMAPLDAEGREWSIRWLSRWGPAASSVPCCQGCHVARGVVPPGSRQCGSMGAVASKRARLTANRLL